MVRGRVLGWFSPGDKGRLPVAGRPTFVVQQSCVEIHPSTRRQGIVDNGILHAIEQSIVIDDLGEDPDRWLVIGRDRAANLVELLVFITAEGDELTIHAMPLRPTYRKLLEP